MAHTPYHDEDEDLQLKADLIEQTPGAGRRGTARGLRAGIRPSATLAPINATLPPASTEPTVPQPPAALGVRGEIATPDVVAQATPTPVVPPSQANAASRYVDEVNRGANTMGSPSIIDRILNRQPKPPAPKPADKKGEAGEFGQIADITTSPLGAVGTTAAVASRGRRIGEGIRNLGTKIGSAVRSPLQTARGLVGGTVGKLGAAGAIGAAVPEAFGTTTEQYEKRFGFEPSDIESPGLRAVRDVGVRALGAASDIGNVATFGQAGKLFRDKQPTAATTPGLRADPNVAARDDAEQGLAAQAAQDAAARGESPSYGAGGEPAKFPGVSTGGETPEINLRTAPVGVTREDIRTYMTPMETLQREAAVRRGGQGGGTGLRGVPILPGAFGSLAALGAAGAAGRVTQAQQKAQLEAEKVGLARDVAAATAGRAGAQLDLQERQFGETQRSNQLKELDTELDNLATKIAGGPQMQGGLAGTSFGATAEKPEAVKERIGRIKSGMKSDIDYTLATQKKDWARLNPSQRQSLYLMAALKQRVEESRASGDRSLAEYFGTKRFDSRDLTQYIPTEANTNILGHSGGYTIKMKGGNEINVTKLAGGEFQWLSANKPVDSDIVALFAPLIAKREGR